MPRHGRNLSENKIYHVMMRGNEKKDIFCDEDDKERILDIFCKTREKGWFIVAYCLMNNHVHLIINEGEDQLARIMKRINTSYAYYFNKRYGRVGHLFQDRYKSEAIDTEKYLLAAVRYIHNNPIKAGLVKTPEHYRWSSFNAYLSVREDPIIQKEIVIGLFSEDRYKAIKGFREFSRQENNDVFLDYNEDDLAKWSQNQVNDYLNFHLVKLNIDKEMLRSKGYKNYRDEVVRHIREKSNLSIREIAAISGLDKNMVNRIQ